MLFFPARVAFCSFCNAFQSSVKDSSECISLFVVIFCLIFDLQAAALPVILGRGGVPKQSFIGQAQSGSGKTAAFVLGFLDQMTPDNYTQVREIAMFFDAKLIHVGMEKALVVAPTLELAEQIFKDVLKMGKDLKVSSYKSYPSLSLKKFFFVAGCESFSFGQGHKDSQDQNHRSGDCWNAGKVVGSRQQSQDARFVKSEGVICFSFVGLFVNPLFKRCLCWMKLTPS
jgi:hypothetical protein